MLYWSGIYTLLNRLWNSYVIRSNTTRNPKKRKKLQRTCIKINTPLSYHILSTWYTDKRGVLSI